MTGIIPYNPSPMNFGPSFNPGLVPLSLAPRYETQLQLTPKVSLSSSLALDLDNQDSKYSILEQFETDRYEYQIDQVSAEDEITIGNLTIEDVEEEYTPTPITTQAKAPSKNQKIVRDLVVSTVTSIAMGQALGIAVKAFGIGKLLNFARVAGPKSSIDIVRKLGFRGVNQVRVHKGLELARILVHRLGVPKTIEVMKKIGLKHSINLLK